jgi:Tol biopolymer transport system component
MTMHRAAVVVLGVLAVALLSPAAAGATLPGQNGQIAYNEYNGHDDVVTVNPNGTNLVNITNDAPFDLDPAWSPDGSKLVFARSTFLPDGTQLYTMNADGSGKRQLTHFPTGSVLLLPTWSPDGSRIVFLYDEGTKGTLSIYTMARDGSDVRRVTGLGGYVTIAPRWSPAGDRILFSDQSVPGDDGTGDYDLYTVRPDGSDRRPVATLPSTSEADPDWSPNGRQIVYSVQTGFTATLHRMNADGTGIVNLHVSGDDPVWSPDGRKLAFRTWDPNSDGDLFPHIVATVNADGSNRRDLDAPNNSSGAPSWQRLPTAKAHCLHGGWRNYGDRFTNQGDCIQFVKNGG